MSTTTNRRNLAKIPVAADHYGVHPITIRRWIAAGRIAAYRVGPRLLMIDLDEADAALEPVTRAKAGEPLAN